MKKHLAIFLNNNFFVILKKLIAQNIIRKLGSGGVTIQLQSMPEHVTQREGLAIFLTYLKILKLLFLLVG